MLFVGFFSSLHHTRHDAPLYGWSELWYNTVQSQQLPVLSTQEVLWSWNVTWRYRDDWLMWVASRWMVLRSLVYMLFVWYFSVTCNTACTNLLINSDHKPKQDCLSIEGWSLTNKTPSLSWSSPQDKDTSRKLNSVCHISRSRILFWVLNVLYRHTTVKSEKKWIITFTF